MPLLVENKGGEESNGNLPHYVVCLIVDLRLIHLCSVPAYDKKLLFSGSILIANINFSNAVLVIFSRSRQDSLMPLSCCVLENGWPKNVTACQMAEENYYHPNVSGGVCYVSIITLMYVVVYIMLVLSP